MFTRLIAPDIRLETATWYPVLRYAGWLPLLLGSLPLFRAVAGGRA